MTEHREGWMGDEYVRLYAPSSRLKIAALYGFNEFLSGYELYGSWGQDALCFGRDGKFYRIPWIPLAESHRQEAYSSAEAFNRALAIFHEATPAYEHFGKELHFTTPIVFGGNPNESGNLVMVDQAAHAQLCRYWNGVYARLKATGK